MVCNLLSMPSISTNYDVTTTTSVESSHTGKTPVPTNASSIASSSVDTNAKRSASIALLSGFAEEAAIHAVEDLIGALTDNGDLTFGACGTDTPSSALLELDQKMVRPVSKFVPPPASRRKDGHYAPDPEMGKVPEHLKSILDSRFQAFVDRTASLPFAEQGKWWSLTFRYLFYLRNLRGEGKRERMLFYYLFEKVHAHFPKTVAALVGLVPDYGYFGDLDHLVTLFHAKGVAGAEVVNAAISVYLQHLDADALQVFGKPLKEVTLDEAKAFNAKLKAMTATELATQVKGKRLSLASKWFKREGKKESDHRALVLARLYPETEVKDVALRKKRITYANMRFRNIISTLTQLLQVGEQLMCSEGKEGQIARNWADINPDHAPAVFVTKYRKALLNEASDKVLDQASVDTGNRSTRADRIECRKHVLTSILTGKLKGANQDLARLSEIIMGHLTASHSGLQHATISPSLSSAERSLINQQWEDMVKAVRELIEEVAKEHADDPEYLDPRNVIPVVDTSGSMTSAKVQDKAIGLGILATTLSNLPGCLISFSDKPKLFHLDTSGDIFSKFLTICNGPTGLNTNIDATYRVLLDLMVSKKVTKTDFALLILTDGQFDSQLVHFTEDRDGSGYGYGYSCRSSADMLRKFETVFLGRMEKAFQEKGYTLPRTIFWNLNGQTPGFPAAEATKGVQMVSGFSQTLMKQVFTGEYKLVIDETTGTARVSVDPWTAFLKAITSETFQPVLRVVLSVKEGVMKHFVPAGRLPDLAGLRVAGTKDKASLDV
jgi:hypothetical protein